MVVPTMLASSTWRGVLTRFRVTARVVFIGVSVLFARLSSGNTWPGSTVTEAIPDSLLVVQIYALLMRDRRERRANPVQQQSGEASESHDQQRDESNHHSREQRRFNKPTVRVAHVHLLQHAQIVVERDDAHRDGQTDKPQQAGVREVCCREDIKLAEKSRERRNSR